MYYKKRITLEELLNKFNPVQLHKTQKEIANLYYTIAAYAGKEYTGCLTHEALYVDTKYGFNKLEPTFKYKRGTKKADIKTKTYEITGIGKGLQKALYITTGKWHNSLDEIIGSNKASITISKNNLGNIVEISEDSEIYEVLSQLIMSLVVLKPIVDQIDIMIPENEDVVNTDKIVERLNRYSERVYELKFKSGH